ncbi:hypothetical protein PI125_g13199 [Phytophthora idaei]|nr:hypothetical protein PI125_g13199 [Phytophthora idaei]
MSLASPRTTNNVAENVGFLQGLRACHQFGWTPLHVVGGSQLIVNQQRKRIPPKARHLVGYFWQSRRLAYQLQVVTWRHHLRKYNKMADAPANQAMDARISVQVRMGPAQHQDHR